MRLFCEQHFGMLAPVEGAFGRKTFIRNVHQGIGSPTAERKHWQRLAGDCCPDTGKIENCKPRRVDS